MKALVALVCFLCFGTFAKAQPHNEITVVLTNGSTIKGSLKVLNLEGVGVEGLDGNYHAVKAGNIQQLIVKQRKITVTNFAGNYYFKFYPGVNFIAYGQKRLILDWKKLQNMASTINDETLLLSQELGITVKNKAYTQRMHIKGDSNYFRDNYGIIQSFINEQVVYYSGFKSLTILD